MAIRVPPPKAPRGKTPRDMVVSSLRESYTNDMKKWRETEGKKRPPKQPPVSEVVRRKGSRLA